MKFDNGFPLQNWGQILLISFFSIHVATAQDLDIQGHRGCRGLMPENTIPAFLKALALGVTTLELDVVISKDKKVVVSHEPYLSHQICLAPDGSAIREEEAKDYNLYQMAYAEIQRYDCGSKQPLRFPEQQNFSVHKPLLSDVFDTVEQQFTSQHLPPIHDNIEIKSSPQGDGSFHPAPEEFVELVMEVIKSKHLQADRIIIQSFDIRPLQYMRKKYPEMPLALLIENNDTAEKNLERLGFVPEIYSPYYSLVNEPLIEFAHGKGMKIIPWTINEYDDIRQVLGKKVDGIITDYPDRVLQVMRKN